MKVLSLTQPYATLIALGHKRIETRPWSTSYRGPLAIHAAKGLGLVGGKKGFKELCGTEPFCSVLNAAMKAWDTPPKSLREMAERPFMPFGAIVAVCDIYDCRPLITRGGKGYYRDPAGYWVQVSDQECAFGDYTEGRHGFFLADIRTLPEPIAATGALGLWNWEGELEGVVAS